MELRLLGERYGEISERLAVILKTLMKESGEMLNESFGLMRKLLERVES